MSKFLQELEEAIELPVEDEFTVTGRGFAVVVDLANNGYPDLLNRDLSKLFMNKLFKHPKGLHRIIGIETMGHPGREVKKTAFLLKPVGFWHQIKRK